MACHDRGKRVLVDPDLLSLALGIRDHGSPGTLVMKGAQLGQRNASHHLGRTRIIDMRRSTRYPLCLVQHVADRPTMLVGFACVGLKMDELESHPRASQGNLQATSDKELATDYRYSSHPKRGGFHSCRPFGDRSAGVRRTGPSGNPPRGPAEGILTRNQV